MIINKQRFKKILIKEKILTDGCKKEEIQKDSHKKNRFSQMITNKNKCIQITFYRQVKGRTLPVVI